MVLRRDQEHGEVISMKKVIVVFSVLFLLLAGTVFAAPVGKVTLKEGRVDVLKPGKNVATQVAAGDPVDVGDVYRAKSDGKMEITFANKNVIKLAPGTRVEIKEYMQEADKSAGVMKLHRGKVQAVSSEEFVKKVAAFAEGNKFEVHTPNAVAGIRGSNMLVAHDKGSTVVIFISGKGYLYNPQIPGVFTPITAGQVSYVPAPGAAPTAPKTITQGQITAALQPFTPTAPGGPAGPSEVTGTTLSTLVDPNPIGGGVAGGNGTIEIKVTDTPKNIADNPTPPPPNPNPKPPRPEGNYVGTLTNGFFYDDTLAAPLGILQADFTGTMTGAATAGDLAITAGTFQQRPDGTYKMWGTGLEGTRNDTVAAFYGLSGGVFGSWYGNYAAFYVENGRIGFLTGNATGDYTGVTEGTYSGAGKVYKELIFPTALTGATSVELLQNLKNAVDPVLAGGTPAVVWNIGTATLTTNENLFQFMQYPFVPGAGDPILQITSEYQAGTYTNTDPNRNPSSGYVGMTNPTDHIYMLGLANFTDTPATRHIVMDVTYDTINLDYMGTQLITYEGTYDAGTTNPFRWVGVGVAAQEPLKFIFASDTAGGVGGSFFQATDNAGNFVQRGSFEGVMGGTTSLWYDNTGNIPLTTTGIPVTMMGGTTGTTQGSRVWWSPAVYSVDYKQERYTDYEGGAYYGILAGGQYSGNVANQDIFKGGYAGVYIDPLGNAGYVFSNDLLGKYFSGLEMVGLDGTLSREQTRTAAQIGIAPENLLANVQPGGMDGPAVLRGSFLVGENPEGWIGGNEGQGVTYAIKTQPWGVYGFTAFGGFTQAEIPVNTWTAMIGSTGTFGAYQASGGSIVSDPGYWLARITGTAWTGSELIGTLAGDFITRTKIGRAADGYGLDGNVGGTYNTDNTFQMASLGAWDSVPLQYVSAFQADLLEASETGFAPPIGWISGYLGGATSLWTANETTSVPVTVMGQYTHDSLWFTPSTDNLPPLRSINYVTGQNLTYAGGAFYGLAGGNEYAFKAIVTEKTIEGMLAALYIDPTGNAGYLWGGLSGDIYKDINMFAMEGDIYKFQMAAAAQVGVAALNLGANIKTGTLDKAPGGDWLLYGAFDTGAELKGNKGVAATYAIATQPWGIYGMTLSGPLPEGGLTSAPTSFSANMGGTGTFGYSDGVTPDTGYWYAYLSGDVGEGGTAAEGALYGTLDGTFITRTRMGTIGREIDGEASQNFMGTYEFGYMKGASLGPWEGEALHFGGDVGGGTEGVDGLLKTYTGSYFNDAATATGLMGGLGDLFGETPVTAYAIGEYSTTGFAYGEPALMEWKVSGKTGLNTVVTEDDGAYKGYLKGIWSGGFIENAKFLSLYIGPQNEGTGGNDAGYVYGDIAGPYFPNVNIWKAEGELAHVFRDSTTVTPARLLSDGTAVTLGAFWGPSTIPFTGVAEPGAVTIGTVNGMTMGITGENWGIWNAEFGGVYTKDTSTTFSGRVGGGIRLAGANGYWTGMLASTDWGVVANRFTAALTDGYFITPSSETVPGVYGEISSTYGGILGTFDTWNLLYSTAGLQAIGAGIYENVVPLQFEGNVMAQFKSWYAEGPFFDDWGTVNGILGGYQDPLFGTFNPTTNTYAPARVVGLGHFYDNDGYRIWGGDISGRAGTARFLGSGGGPIAGNLMKGLYTGIYIKEATGGGYEAGYLLSNDMTGALHEFGGFQPGEGLWEITSGTMMATRVGNTTITPANLYYGSGYVIKSDEMFFGVTGTGTASNVTGNVLADGIHLRQTVSDPSSDLPWGIIRMGAGGSYTNAFPTSGWEAVAGAVSKDESNVVDGYELLHITNGVTNGDGTFSADFSGRSIYIASTSAYHDTGTMEGVIQGAYGSNTWEAIGGGHYDERDLSFGGRFVSGKFLEGGMDPAMYGTGSIEGMIGGWGSPFNTGGAQFMGMGEYRNTQEKLVLIGQVAAINLTPGPTSYDLKFGAVRWANEESGYDFRGKMLGIYKSTYGTGNPYDVGIITTGPLAGATPTPVVGYLYPGIFNDGDVNHGMWETSVTSPPVLSTIPKPNITSYIPAIAYDQLTFTGWLWKPLDESFTGMYDGSAGYLVDNAIGLQGPPSENWGILYGTFGGLLGDGITGEVLGEGYIKKGANDYFGYWYATMNVGAVNSPFNGTWGGRFMTEDTWATFTEGDLTGITANSAHQGVAFAEYTSEKLTWSGRVESMNFGSWNETNREVEFDYGYDPFPFPLIGGSDLFGGASPLVGQSYPASTLRGLGFYDPDYAPADPLWWFTAMRGFVDGGSGVLNPVTGSPYGLTITMNQRVIGDNVEGKATGLYYRGTPGSYELGIIDSGTNIFQGTVYPGHGIWEISSGQVIATKMAEGFTTPPSVMAPEAALMNGLISGFNNTGISIYNQFFQGQNWGILDGDFGGSYVVAPTGLGTAAGGVMAGPGSDMYWMAYLNTTWGDGRVDGDLDTGVWLTKFTKGLFSGHLLGVYGNNIFQGLLSGSYVEKPLAFASAFYASNYAIVDGFFSADGWLEGLAGGEVLVGNSLWTATQSNPAPITVMGYYVPGEYTRHVWHDIMYSQDFNQDNVFMTYDGGAYYGYVAGIEHPVFQDGVESTVQAEEALFALLYVDNGTTPKAGVLLGGAAGQALADLGADPIFRMDGPLWRVELPLTTGITAAQLYDSVFPFDYWGDDSYDNLAGAFGTKESPVAGSSILGSESVMGFQSFVNYSEDVEGTNPYAKTAEPWGVYRLAVQGTFSGWPEGFGGLNGVTTPVASWMRIGGEATQIGAYTYRGGATKSLANDYGYWLAETVNAGWADGVISGQLTGDFITFTKLGLYTYGTLKGIQGEYRGIYSPTDNIWSAVSAGMWYGDYLRHVAEVEMAPYRADAAGNLQLVNMYGGSAVGLMGGISSLWTTGGSAATMIGLYQVPAGNHVWAQTIYSYNYIRDTWTTYDENYEITNSLPRAYVGFLTGAAAEKTIDGNIVYVYINDNTGQAGLGRGRYADGIADFSIGMMEARNIQIDSPVDMMTAPGSAANLYTTLYQEFDLPAVPTSSSGGGGFSGGGTITPESIRSTSGQIGDTPGWGIWRALQGGTYSAGASVETPWSVVAENHYNIISPSPTYKILGMRAEGAGWSAANKNFIGKTYGYGADLSGADTWISVGETTGTFDPLTRAYQAASAGIWIETNQFLAMAGTEQGRAKLAQLGIPCVEVGMVDLKGSGSGTGWTIDMTGAYGMNDVKFYKSTTNTTGRPEVFGTNKVSGAYTGNPQGGSVVLSGTGGVTANMNMQQWNTSTNKWLSTVNGNAPNGIGTYAQPFQLQGGAAGTISTGTSTFGAVNGGTGTAAGIVK
jgi:hypothetical protein